jgi:hypothetical protein
MSTKPTGVVVTEAVANATTNQKPSKQAIIHGVVVAEAVAGAVENSQYT